MAKARNDRPGSSVRSTSLALLTTALEERVGPDRRPFIVAWNRDLRTAKLRSLLNGQAALTVRLITVGGSLILPVVAGLNLQDAATYAWAPTAVLVISLVIAAATAAQQTIRYGTRWKMYESFAHRMESEAWAFFNRTGSYKGKSDEEAYVDFVESMQSLRDLRQNDLLSKTIEEEVNISLTTGQSLQIEPDGSSSRR